MKTQHPDKMKQKSLMSFFGKASTNVTKAKPGLSSPEGSPKASRSSRTLTDRSSDPPVYETNIPLSKGGSQSSTLGSTNYTRGSNQASSSRDTPATSDPIDVDMLSAEEEEPIGKNTKTKTVRSSLSYPLYLLKTQSYCHVCPLVYAARDKEAQDRVRRF